MRRSYARCRRNGQREPDGKEIGSVRLAWPAALGRVFRVPFSLIEHGDPPGDRGPLGSAISERMEAWLG